MCWYTNAEPRIRLKEPAIAGYVYNPPQTPPFEKEGLCCCPMGNPADGRSGQWSQGDIIDIREFKEFREIKEVKDISEISEDAIVLGLL